MLYNDYLNNRRDYQELGHIFLLEQKHACLFYKPGKGKTYPTIDALRDVDASKNGNARILILSTPDAVKNMWNAEIVPQNILPKNTVIMTFNSAIVEETKKKLLAIKWDVLIVDECHKVKSNNAQTSKLVYKLSRHIEYVWGLTGTPRANNDIDIFNQFHNLCISEWGDISYTQFVNQCCDVEPQYFHGQRIMKPIGINKMYKVGWERNIATYTQRIGYTEDDNMPDLNVEIIELPYTPTKEYLQAEDGCIQLSEYETTMTKLAAITKMHQAVNGFLYYRDENDRQITYKIEPNIKLDWLMNNVSIFEPTVIVYRFKQDLEDLKEAFHNKYTENIDDFKNGKSNVLLLQCSRCESFNLQMCNRIIFYTLDYSYIKYNQMLHRLWRMGQDKPVKVEILTFKNTIETKIWNTVKNKETLADLFMSIKGV